VLAAGAVALLAIVVVALALSRVLKSRPSDSAPPGPPSGPRVPQAPAPPGDSPPDERGIVGRPKGRAAQGPGHTPGRLTGHQRPAGTTGPLAARRLVPSPEPQAATEGP
jgi:hypothetical protein